MRGHTRRRGKTWAYVVDLGPDPQTGKRRQKWKSGFDREKDARRALNEVLGRLQDGTFIADAAAPFASFVDEWLDTRRADLRPSTLHSYTRNLTQHVTPRIGAIPLGKIDAGVLNRLYADLGSDGARRDGRPGGLSARTIQYVSTIVSAALADAVEWGRLTTNPALRARPPRPRSSGARQIDAWDAATLRDFLERSNVYGDRYYPLWVVLASTGARRGEVLGLRWRDLDLDAGQLTITQTVIAVDHKAQLGEPKTEQGRRSIAIDSGTVAVLKRWRARQAEERLSLGSGYRDQGLVFAKLTGQVLHPERVSREFDRRVQRWELPRIPLHGLRHTWATLALQAGVHPRVVQERLGHSTIAITLGVYSHVSPKLDAGAAKLVASSILPSGA